MIPIKPINAMWTDAQWQAVYTTGQDVLVSAAAGSGKTAVLIERMIERVLTEHINIDELLVVTFTNASAAEMRHRLAAAIDKALQTSDTPHIRRQQALLNKAHISTLHAFCLTVVKQYAYTLDIDPAFRMATTDETALLKDDALALMLEEVYASGDVKLLHVIDSFTSDRSDEAIETIIERLYERSRAQVNPLAWLQKMASQYDTTSISSIDQLPLSPQLRQSLQQRVARIANMSELYEAICSEPSGPFKYADDAALLLSLFTSLERDVAAAPWSSLAAQMTSITFARLPSIRKTDDVDPALKARAAKLRDDIKKQVTALQQDYFIRSEERYLQDIAAMHPIVAGLAQLVINFEQRYSTMKRERAIVDFSDLEHFALDILTEHVDGVPHPSPIALDYKRQFKEVLVDEYQDSATRC